MTTHKIESDSIKLPESWQGKAVMLALVGFVLICLSGLVFFLGERPLGLRTLMHSYLANFVYCISFGIGAMFFVLISFFALKSAGSFGWGLLL